MRSGTAILAVVTALFSSAVRAQTRPARSATEMTLPQAQYSLLGGETVPSGMDVVSAEVGWPSVTFGFTHGTGPTSDVGLRFDLLYGVVATGDALISALGEPAPNLRPLTHRSLP